MINFEAEALVDSIDNVENLYMAKEYILATWSDDGHDVVTPKMAEETAINMGWLDFAANTTPDFEVHVIDWSEVAAFWTLQMLEYTEETELEFEPVKGATVEVW